MIAYTLSMILSDWDDLHKDHVSDDSDMARGRATNYALPKERYEGAYWMKRAKDCPKCKVPHESSYNYCPKCGTELQ